MLDGPFELAGIEPLKLIGSGGFGEVWLARQTNIDRQVAIKVGHSPINDDTVRIRFERECIALGRLSGHPNIVDVFTAGQLDDGRPYLMLEYIDGGTLWRRLKKGPLSESELRFTGIELADALSVAHGAGVLHRDLKPENILLRSNGEAVLGDFGIARLQDGLNTTSHPITASVAYAAPEILTGKDATIASDLYGLGVCLLTAATRAVPFMESSDESVHPVIERVLAEDAPNLQDHGYSKGFADLVARLLSKQGKHRPQTAEEIRDEIYRLNDIDPLPDDLLVATPADGVEAATGEGIITTGRSRLGRNSISGLRGRTTSGSVRLGASVTDAGAQTRPSTDSDVAATPVDGDRRRGRPRRGRGRDGGRRRRSRGRTRRALFAVAFAVGLIVAAGLASLAVTGRSANVLDFGSGGEPTDAALSLGPLTLPLTDEDLDLGEGARVEIDATGPDSSQFCGNTPTTDGLVDWTGLTNSGEAGFPVVFQQLARFDSPQQAAAYVDSYLAGVDCQRWTIPDAEGGEPLVVLPQAKVDGDPPGDQSIEVAFDGAEGLALSGRVALIRSGTEVYTLSVTSPEPADLEVFETWLGDSVRELAY